MSPTFPAVAGRARPGFIRGRAAGFDAHCGRGCRRLGLFAGPDRQGVPPVAHPRTFTVWIDRALLAFDEVWAAAGTPHAVFRIDGPITAILDDYRVIEIN